MGILQIAWRNLQQRGLASLLTALSLALGVSLVVAVLLLSGFIRSYFTGNMNLGFNLVVGSKGSSTQLVLNSVYHLDSTLEPLPYSYYKKFTEGEFAPYTQLCVPICMGDSYEGFRVVGTTPDFCNKLADSQGDGQPFAFRDGRNFAATDYFSAVVGAKAAQATGLKVGGKFQPVHGVDTSHKHDPFVVVGVLAATGTPIDNAIYINIEGFYLQDDHAKPATKAAEKVASHGKEVFGTSSPFRMASAAQDPPAPTSDPTVTPSPEPTAAPAPPADQPAVHAVDPAATKPAGAEDHAHDDHAHDDHPQKSDAHDEHVHDDHAHEDHAHDGHAHDEHAHDDHAHGVEEKVTPSATTAEAAHEHEGHDHADHATGAHAPDEHAHDDHAHDEHAHDEHAHDEHAHDEHAHDDHGHEGHDHAGHSHAHTPLPESQREVTALLVKVPIGNSQDLAQKINEGTEAQAALPIGVIQKLMNDVVGPLFGLLLGLCVLIVVVSAIGILVSIYNSMSERRREIAVMRALGANRGTVMGIVLAESLLLSMLGGAAGWLLGHLLVMLIGPLVGSYSGGTVGLLYCNPYELILLPGLIVVALIAGLLPALLAYRVDVSQNLSP